MLLEPKTMAWDLDDGEMERRTACALSLSWAGGAEACRPPPVTVVCTHLDAYKESSRMPHVHLSAVCSLTRVRTQG